MDNQTEMRYCRGIITKVGGFCLALCLCASAAGKIAPADTQSYRYTGRVDATENHAVELSWPGSSVSANFTGQALSVILDDDQGKNYFSVIVDGDDQFPYVIEAKAGRQSYWISNTLGPGPHQVTIYKRTEGEEGATRFVGLELAEEGQLLPPPAPAQRKIEIYGDSITSGMGNEAPVNGADDDAGEKNHYWSYAAIAARALDADLHTISQSGIGVMVSWFGFTMPDFYDQLSAVGNNDTQWDFSRWTPDVVVVNLLQNDSWLVADPKRISPTPSESQIVQSYKEFISHLRDKYPNAYLLCALGSMDATKPGSPWPDYVADAASQLQAAGDNKVATLVLPFNGYGAHPRVMQHQRNGALLAAKIRELTGW